MDVRDVKSPERPAGFARIRLLLGGICNTDLELQRGYYDSAQFSSSVTTTVTLAGTGFGQQVTGFQPGALQLTAQNQTDIASYSVSSWTDSKIIFNVTVNPGAGDGDLVTVSVTGGAIGIDPISFASKKGPGTGGTTSTQVRIVQNYYKCPDGTLNQSPSIRTITQT